MMFERTVTALTWRDRGNGPGYNSVSTASVGFQPRTFGVQNHFTKLATTAQYPEFEIVF